MNFVRVLLLLGAAATAAAADPEITAEIVPAEITLGQSADLTVTISGNGQPGTLPPEVPGLEFAPVGQSRHVESINGVVSSTFSLTYRVSARHAGTYVISSIAPGVRPLVLRVDEAGSAPGANAGPPGPPSTPPASANAPAAGEGRAAAAGAAFVRLLVPTQEIYVGQSVPVEIQVGTRDGVVVSLNGLPTLDGDAFTLDKLSAQPERRTEETIDGKPYTIFTWHSVLAAIKPGRLSVTMGTPLTVRIPVRRPTAQFLDDSSLDDAFDDPAFQGFFGGSAQKDVTVSSSPVNFMVLELPTQDKPPDFTGAVGQFKIGSELADARIVVGDPATLRFTISGDGNFDRVNSPMLAESSGWKTYQPTAKFKSSDGSAYRGEKTFEQPVVAGAAGKQTLPGLIFSYFDPAARRYETLHTAPLSIDVQPASTGSPAVRAAAAPVAAAPTPGATPAGAPKPDHAPTASFGNSLVPFYFQPRYVALASFMAAAFPALWLWFGRRERRARAGAGMRREIDPARLLAAMDRACESGNEEDFFRAATALLRRTFASRWSVAPAEVTLVEIDRRLGSDSDVRKLFVLADEARYSGRRFSAPDLSRWKRLVRRELQEEAVA